MERKFSYQFIIVLKSSVKSQNLKSVQILSFPYIVEGCGLVEEAGVNIDQRWWRLYRGEEEW